jgi:murein DD-endopeptidase MepM/ murein hydrolase activator NlpD
MNVHLRTIISLLLTINFPLGLVGVHIPEVREISSSTAKNSNELFIDPNQRIVDNSIIRLRWDLNNPEFIKEFIYKPLDPNLNLTSYWTGSGAFDDEFLGNSWSIDDPQSGGIVVVGRGQIGTWSVVTDTLGAANVTITSVGSQGFPITTTYRIEADSPQIQVQRVFGFSSKPLSTTMGFRPYMFRVSRSLGFDQYVMPLTNGSIITGSATTCPYGCNRIDWAGTWADLLAPSLCPDGIGIALINLTKTSPGIWVDHDLNSNSAYIAATPLNNSEYLNYNVSVTYRYCVHTGNFQDAKECSASQPFLDLPFSHSPGDDGFDWIYSFFDHEYPIYTSEPSTAADSIVIFSGARRTIGKKCVGGLNCYSGHDGYDFSVSEGSPVLAAHGGWAAGTQWTCKGSTPINVVSVTQGRYQTVYLHLQGDSYWQSLKNNPRLVRLGDRIGTVGNSGSPNCSTGPHLHFGLYYDTNNDGKFSSSEKVDPYGFITTQEDPWTTYRDSHPISEWMWAFNPSAQTTINPNSGLVLASGNINVNVPFGSVSDPTLLSLMLVPEPTNRSTILTETSDKHKETTLEPLDVGYTFQLSAVSENSTPLTSFNKV